MGSEDNYFPKIERPVILSISMMGEWSWKKYIA